MRPAYLLLGLSLTLPLLVWQTTATAGVDGGSLDSSTETSVSEGGSADAGDMGDSSGPVESSTDGPSGGGEIGIEGGLDGPVTRPDDDAKIDEDAKSDDDAGGDGAASTSSGGGCSLSVPLDDSGGWSVGLILAAAGLTVLHARRRRSG
jgi:hypothetical protein